MSTNHTPNYNLSQWVKSDQVRMEDFNADNARIDTALNGIGRIHILKQFDGNYASYNLENFNWTEWALVGATLYIPFNSNTSSFMACSLRRTSGSLQTDCSGDIYNFAHMGNTSSVLILTPFHDPEREVRGVYLGNQSGAGFASCKFSELKSLTLSGGGSFPSGCRITLWGVK